MRTERARPQVAGLSAPEAIAALLLGLFVLHLGLSTMARLRSLEGRLAARADGLVSMRVARHVLRSELRRGTPGSDWEADGDSLWLRAFRGTALVCPHDSSTVELTVSFTGERRPDPSKDSVLLVDPMGVSEARALVAVHPASIPCGPLPADSLERWALDTPVAPGAVVGRLYERGSYHLALSALRYRRWSSGRQPLTPEVWSNATGFAVTGARLGIEVFHGSPRYGPDWQAFIASTEVE